MIVNSTIPGDSILNDLLHKMDYIDCYSCNIGLGGKSLRMEDVGKAFFTSEPTWIKRLFAIRNKLVKMFGLKIPKAITDRQKLLDNFKCNVGESMGFFQVFAKNDHELILGEDDKHLNFRVSLYINNNGINQDLIVTTVVQFNQWAGKLYFLFVKPFHRLIVPAMVREMVKQLESK